MTFLFRVIQFTNLTFVDYKIEVLINYMFVLDVIKQNFFFIFYLINKSNNKIYNLFKNLQNDYPYL